MLLETFKLGYKKLSSESLWQCDPFHLYMGSFTPFQGRTNINHVTCVVVWLISTNGSDTAKDVQIDETAELPSHNNTLTPKAPARRQL